MTQVLGLLGPTQRPANVEDVLAGNPGGGLATTPYSPQQPRQVAGLFNSSPSAATPSAFQTGGAAAFSGLAAADAGGTSYDGTSAGINIAAATAGGAASGAMVGGPWGAAIGGGVALIGSSLKAWMDVKGENERKSKMEALIRDVETKQNKKDQLARQDSLSQLRYDRGQAALQQAWGVAQSRRDSIIKMINDSATLRQRYLQTGTLSRYN